ncbi:MAG TPA: zinc ribbon domain-containing protein [Bryobacteraceae bacterium]|jgi:hypothetical protein|nr:zinc ribbon domain-containing protein [Bryobacteraceae bacterium]
MPEFCTCGTALVENARFCHRCGRPTFESPAIASETSEAEPVIQPAGQLRGQPAVTPLHSAFRSATAGPLPVNFRNPVALRVAFLMSIGIILIEMIPGVQLFLVLWWLAAGWGAVLLYRKLTGFALSVRAGAQLGSITGVLIFLGMAVIIAFTVLATGNELFEQMVKQNPQISTVLNDPPELALGVLVMVFIMFAMVVGTCAAGGALGARFAGRGGAGNTPAA